MYADNFSVLRSLPAPSSGVEVTVAGYAAVGDEGGGLFCWDAASLADDNDGTILRPSAVAAASPGRWKRLYDDVIDVRWFGAVADNGQDDTLALQNAVNAAATAHVPVLVPQGVFQFSTLQLKANTRLVGAGGTLKLNDNVCSNPLQSYYLVHNLDGNGSGYPNVVIDGLIIDGNNATNTQFTVADALTLSGDNIRITNCTILNPPDSGIMFSRVTHAHCNGNRISGAKDVGIYVNDGNGQSFYDNVISSNIITGCYYGGIALKRQVTRCIVESNVIEDCGNGITLENASTNTDFSYDVSICHNRMRNIGFGQPLAAGQGIVVRGGSGSLVSNNRIDGTYKNGIIIQGSRGNNIAHNNISGRADALAAQPNGNNAITLVDREGNAPSDNQVCGNIINSMNGAGILVNSAVVLTGNLITGNIITDQLGNQLGNIHWTGQGGTACTVDGNHISNGQNSGMVIAATSAVSGCSFSRNHISNVLNNGIRLAGSTDNTLNSISDNTIRQVGLLGGSGGFALNVEATWKKNTLSGNCLDKGTGSFDLQYFSGATDNILLNNAFVSGTASGNITQPNRVAVLRHGVPGNIVATGTAAPTANTWKTGDMVWNTAGADGGVWGWYCIAGGTPGTWLKIGLIGAERAAASADSAPAPGATYSQSQVQSLLNELRDLKNKLRTAGLLA